MKIIEVDPKKCVRWKFADRSGFEFGDIYALAQDIQKNGQVEPVLMRPLKDQEDHYEIIAGSRRWKACLEADIFLKGLVKDFTDHQAAIAQIKENQKVELCDYSKGFYYAKLLKEKTMTHAALADIIGCSKAKLENFLSFEKVPPVIWDAVGNLSRVSSRTSSTIYALSKKGEEYNSALIDLAEDIRKGAGSKTIEQKVMELINGPQNSLDYQKKIELPSGRVVATWTKSGIQFAKDIPLDQKEFHSFIIEYFQRQMKESKRALL